MEGGPLGWVVVRSPVGSGAGGGSATGVGGGSATLLFVISDRGTLPDSSGSSSVAGGEEVGLDTEE